MNDTTHKYHVSPAGVGEMLTGGGEFLPPGKLLGDLTEAQALAVPPGSLYSIAGIVAHMHFWQERNIARARGANMPRPEHLDDTFPTPQAGKWNNLRASFLDGLGVCAQIAAEKGSETSPERRHQPRLRPRRMPRTAQRLPLRADRDAASGSRAMAAGRRGRLMVKLLQKRTYRNCDLLTSVTR